MKVKSKEAEPKWERKNREIVDTWRGKGNGEKKWESENEIFRLGE